MQWIIVEITRKHLLVSLFSHVQINIIHCLGECNNNASRLLTRSHVSRHHGFLSIIEDIKSRAKSRLHCQKFRHWVPFIESCNTNTETRLSEVTTVRSVCRKLYSIERRLEINYAYQTQQKKRLKKQSSNMSENQDTMKSNTLVC